MDTLISQCLKKQKRKQTNDENTDHQNKEFLVVCFFCSSILVDSNRDKESVRERGMEQKIFSNKHFIFHITLFCFSLILTHLFIQKKNSA